MVLYVCSIRYTLYEIRFTLHASRNSPLHLSRTLYKSALFWQNKPNLLNAKMNVNKVLTKDYENVHLLGRRKNKPNSKPNQTQYKANFKRRIFTTGRLKLFDR